MRSTKCNKCIKKINSKDRNPLFIAQIRVKKKPIRIRAIRGLKKIIHEQFVANSW